MKSNEPAANNMVEEAELMFWIATIYGFTAGQERFPEEPWMFFLKVSKINSNKRPQISENTRSRPPAERHKTEHIRLQLGDV